MNLNRISTLVLNASYEPISICSARRAITLIVKDAALIEEDYDIEVYPGILLPSVIRLKTYKRIPIRISNLTRDNIYLRDRFLCQYCNTKFDRKSLTLDHIMPESRGGKYEWSNLVACCRVCNHKKGNKTPEEAGMKLLHKPKIMTIHTSRALIRLMGLKEDAKWARYLYA